MSRKIQYVKWIDQLFRIGAWYEGTVPYIRKNQKLYCSSSIMRVDDTLSMSTVYAHYGIDMLVELSQISFLSRFA
jgi:hypothetical protein